MAPIIRLVPTGNDEFGGPVNRALDDGSDSWWGGVAQCFAGVALAATVAASALGAQLGAEVHLQEQHEITQAPATVVDGDAGWIPGPPAVPVANLFATVIQVAQPWSFDNPDPSGPLYVAQDELPAPVTVIPWPNAIAPAPWSFEQHESAASLYNPQDENPAPLVVVPPLQYVVPQPWAFEQHEDIAQSVTVVDDSGDAWSAWTPSVPPLPPVSPSSILPPAWGFAPDEIQPIEDDDPGSVPIVLQGAAPTIAPGWSYEQHEQAAGLYVPQDELPAPVVTPPWPSTVVPPTWGFEQHEAPPRIADDSGDVWTPAIVARGQILPSFVAPSTTDGDIPSGLRGQPDEDYWNNPVAPVPASLTPPAPWSFEQHEIAGIVLYPDEDYWQNRVAPVPATLSIPSQASFEQHERATGLYVVQDEDPKPVAVPPWASPIVPLPWQFEQQDVVVAVPADDDAWRLPVPSIAARSVSAFAAEDEFPAIAIHEADAATIALPIPTPRVVTAFTADDDLPARTLVDDDPGYQPRGIVPAPVPIVAWSSDAHEAPPRIADDTGDVWTVILTPWPATITPAPWSLDPSDLPTFSIDDDSGTSGSQLALGAAVRSASQLASVVASQPIADAEDVPADLVGQPDEDFWINAVAPVPMAFVVPCPWAWEQHDRVVPPNAAVAGPRPTTATLTPHIATVSIDQPVASVLLDAAVRTVTVDQPTASVTIGQPIATTTLTTVVRTVELKD